jgi:hypothetical protein
MQETYARRQERTQIPSKTVPLSAMTEIASVWRSCGGPERASNLGVRASVEVTEAGWDCAAVDETYRRIVSRRGFVDRSEQPASINQLRRLPSLTLNSITPRQSIQRHLGFFRKPCSGRSAGEGKQHVTRFGRSICYKASARSRRRSCCKRRLRHRLHARGPPARLPVQVLARLLATAVPALGRVDGPAHDAQRRQPRKTSAWGLRRQHGPRPNHRPRRDLRRLAIGPNPLRRRRRRPRIPYARWHPPPSQHDPDPARCVLFGRRFSRNVRKWRARSKANLEGEAVRNPVNTHLLVNARCKIAAKG